MRTGRTAFLALTLAWATGVSWATEPLQVHFPSLDRTPLSAWLFRPVGYVRGTVVALHGCGGLFATAGARAGQPNARHQAMAQMLVDAGYAVLFPDSFGARGESQLCTQKLGQRGITQTQRRRDALAALRWTAAQPWARADQIALLGWSHGGSAVLAATDAQQAEVMASGLRFAAAVAFYPGCSAALKAGYRPNTRLTLLLGEKDDWTASAPCIELGRAAGAEVQVYRDAYHDFDNPLPGVRLRHDVPNGVHPGQGVHVGRNAAAREQAYARVLQLLSETFADPGK